jgi:chromosome segregation ATPase
MKNDFLQALTRYHREVFLPDFQRILDEAVEKSAKWSRKEKSEYYGLKSWTSYLDDRLARVETEVRSTNSDTVRVESELQFIKSHLRALEFRIADIDKEIDRLATDSELVEIRKDAVNLNDRIAALETRH